MNVQIRDREAFARLNPLDVMAYLRAAGWQEVDHRPDHSCTWRRSVEGSTAEVLVPLNRGFGDFLSRMADVVFTLAAVEGRSQLEVLADLENSTADLVRVRVEEAGDVVSLDGGAMLLDGARRLIRAVARSAWRPEEAEDLLRTLRVGALEAGRFGLTVQGRLPPRLTEAMNLPAQRWLLQGLAHSLVAVREAAVTAASDGSFEAFRKAVPQTVGVELCSALAEMGGPPDQPWSLSFSFRWSVAWPAPTDLPREVRIERDLTPTLAEAARVFRETAVREAFDLAGVVVSLDRREDALVGRATVLGFIDGRPRRVNLELQPDSYDLAIRAHQDRATIRCLGELRKVERTLHLDNPRGFTIVPEDAITVD